ncbi:MAG: SRPBCC family protein [Candidatus Methylomirabilis oxygeniifera]|nr:MAG: SRPBCC family protein [Candidatus Methylomirabilis oxyfera]
MKTLLYSIIGIALCTTSVAYAHGPTPQKLEEHISIQGPPEQVWAAVKEFGAPATWHPMLKQTTAHGGNTAGRAERVVTLPSGGTITEGLDEYDEGRRYMAWRLLKENKEAFPVSFYTVSIEVRRANGGSDVEWLSRFYRADTGNSPPPEYSDEAAIKAMTEFAQSGLENLKKRIETEK